MKKVSYAWIVLTGLLVPAAILAMFSKLISADFLTPLAYAVLFAAGAAGGAILVAFLNRAKNATARWIVFIAFLLASFPAILMMLFGSAKMGPVGVVLFPLLPWALITWLGSLLGDFVARKMG